MGKHLSDRLPTQAEIRNVPFAVAPRTKRGDRRSTEPAAALPPVFRLYEPPNTLERGLSSYLLIPVDVTASYRSVPFGLLELNGEAEKRIPLKIAEPAHPLYHLGHAGHTMMVQPTVESLPSDELGKRRCIGVV